MLFRDARDYQIFFLSTFLFLGVIQRDWNLQVDLILAAILSCICTQTFLSYLVEYTERKKKRMRQFNQESRSDYHLSWQEISSWRSAAITALGLC